MNSQKTFENIEVEIPDSNNRLIINNKIDNTNSVDYEFSINEISDKKQNELIINKIELKISAKKFWSQKLINQTKLMIWKNYLVFSRNIKPTIFQIFTPVLICFILVFLQLIVEKFNSTFIKINPIPKKLDNLGKCHSPVDCVTVGYGIIKDKKQSNSSVTYIHSLMKNVAESNNLTYETDIKLLTMGSATEFFDYFINNENKTKYGVMFCTDKIEYNNISIPCSFEYTNETLHFYTIYYNVTNSPNPFLTSTTLPSPSDHQLMKLKIDLDNSYLKMFSNDKNISDIPKIQAQVNSFPMTENRFYKNADVVSSTGAFYFFFPPIICFVVMLLEIMREKELKLRKSLIIIGLNSIPFWLSWLITGCFLAFLSSFMMLISGIICQFDVFTNSPLIITFSLFFFFNITMQFLAFFLSTILKSQKSAYTVKIFFKKL